MGLGAMGPSCCCCDDVYIRGNPQRVNGKTGDLINTAGGSPLAAAIYFDLVNKHLYFNRNTATSIGRLDQDLTNEITFLSLGASERVSNGLAVHPQNEHLFFGRFDNPGTTSRYVTRINLDGTGQTDIATHVMSSVSSVVAAVIDMCVSRDDEYVFYLLADNGTAWENRRCNADGTGDTSIYTYAAGESNLGGMSVDNGRGTLYFSRFTTGPTSRIMRCDWDGANVATIFTATSTDLPRLAGYSHAKDRVYFWNESSTAGRDAWCSVDPDGGDFQQEILATDWDGSDSPVYCKLGCGFETLGAGTLGS